MNRMIPTNEFFSKSNKISSDQLGLHWRSLIDLTGNHQQQKERKRAFSLTDTVSLREDFVGLKIIRQNSCWTENTNEAGRRIINLLMLNAWRRRREDNAETQGMVKRLTDEVDSLNMQMYVLRELLYSNRRRVISTAQELRQNLLKMEKFEEEKQLLVKEKECLEYEIKDLQDLITDLQSKCKNLENDLDTTKFESETWELRLKKERKKLKVAKEENACLRKEAHSKDHQLDYQSQCLDELNQTVKQLQQQLESQHTILNQAMDQIHSTEEKLKLSDELGMEKERIIVEKNLEIKELRYEITLLEEKFQAQDERNGELNKLILEKSKELNIINEKLRDMAKNEKFWGKKMVKMTSFCTRIPVACFYTLATLLLPQPWYRFL